MICCITLEEKSNHLHLQKVLLLRIFLQCHEELPGVGFFRINQVTESLKDEHWCQLKSLLSVRTENTHYKEKA